MSELISLFGDGVEVPTTDSLRKHKCLELEAGSDVKIGACGILGRRASMEDEHVVVNIDADHILLAVFDGHGGGDSSAWLQDHFVPQFCASSYWQEYKASGDTSTLSSAFKDTFLELDSALRISGADQRSGSCAIACLITPSLYVCANLGDSRCVLGRIGDTVALSVDHKPECEEEEKRIVAAGGQVTFVKGDVYRVNSVIAVSRSIGDFVMKEQTHLPPSEQFVSCVPEVSIHPRTSEDDLLLLACDGMWDVLTNDMALDRAREAFTLYGETSALRIAEELLDYAYEEGSGDNISVIVARLQGAAVPDADVALQGGVDVFRRRREAHAEVPAQIYYQNTPLVAAPFSPFADLEE